MDEIDNSDGSGFSVVEYCGWLSCRKPIIQSGGRGRRREFCSEACRRAAERDYKRAKTLAEVSDRQLRNFRHEVAAYGRKADTDDGFRTPEEESRVIAAAQAAVSRAETVLEYSNEVDDRYLDELRRLVEAVTPILPPPVARASA